jgi:hypothetical protein
MEVRVALDYSPFFFDGHSTAIRNRITQRQDIPHFCVRGLATRSGMERSGTRDWQYILRKRAPALHNILEKCVRELGKLLGG